MAIINVVKQEKFLAYQNAAEVKVGPVERSTGLLALAGSILWGGSAAGAIDDVAPVRAQTFQDFCASLDGVERQAVQNDIKTNPEILLNLYTHNDEIGQNDPSALGALLNAAPTELRPFARAGRDAAAEHKAMSEVLMRALAPHITTLANPAATPAAKETATAFIMRVQDMYTKTAGKITNEELDDYFQTPLYPMLFELLKTKDDVAQLCTLAYYEENNQAQQGLVRSIYAAKVEQLINTDPVVTATQIADFAALTDENTRRVGLPAPHNLIGDQLTALVEAKVVALLANGVPYNNLNDFLRNVPPAVVADGAAAPAAVTKVEQALKARLQKLSTENGYNDSNSRNDAFTLFSAALEANGLPARMKSELKQQAEKAMPALYAQGVSLDKLARFSRAELIKPKMLVELIHAKTPFADAEWLAMARTFESEPGMIGAFLPKELALAKLRSAIKAQQTDKLNVLLDDYIALNPAAIAAGADEEKALDRVSRTAALNSFREKVLLTDELAQSFKAAVEAKSFEFIKAGLSPAKVNTDLQNLFVSAAEAREVLFDAALTHCEGAGADAVNQFNELVLQVKKFDDPDKAEFVKQLNQHAITLCEQGVSRADIDAFDGQGPGIVLVQQVKARLIKITDVAADTDEQREQQTQSFTRLVKHVQSYKKAGETSPSQETRDKVKTAMNLIVEESYALVQSGVALPALEEASAKVSVELLKTQMEKSLQNAEAEDKEIAKSKIENIIERSGDYQQQVLALILPTFTNDAARQTFENKFFALDDDKRNALLAHASFFTFLKVNKASPIDATATEEEQKETKAKNEANKIISSVTFATLTAQYVIIESQLNLLAGFAQTLAEEKPLGPGADASTVNLNNALLGDGELGGELFSDNDPLRNLKKRIRGEARPSQHAADKLGAVDAGGANAGVFKYDARSAAQVKTNVETLGVGVTARQGRAGQLSSEVERFFRHQKELRTLQAEIQSATRTAAARTAADPYAIKFKRAGKIITINNRKEFAELLEAWQSSLTRLLFANKANDKIALIEAMDVRLLQEEYGERYLEQFAKMLESHVNLSFKKTVNKDKASFDSGWFHSRLSYDKYEKHFQQSVKPRIIAAKASREQHGKQATALLQLAQTIKAVDTLCRESPHSATFFVQLKLMLKESAEIDSIGYSLLKGDLESVALIIKKAISQQKMHVAGLETDLAELKASHYSAYGKFTGSKYGWNEFRKATHLSDDEKRRKSNRESLLGEIAAQQKTIQLLEFLKDYCVQPTDGFTKFEKLLTEEYKASSELGAYTKCESLELFHGVPNSTQVDAKTTGISSVSFGAPIAATNVYARSTTQIAAFVDKNQVHFAGAVKYMQNKLRSVTVHVEEVKEQGESPASATYTVRSQKAANWHSRTASDKTGGFPKGDRNCMGTAISMLLAKIDSITALNVELLKPLAGNEYKNALARLLKIPFTYNNVHDKDTFRSMTDAADVERFAVIAIAVAKRADVTLTGLDVYPALTEKADKLLQKDENGECDLDRIAKRSPVLQEGMVKLLSYKNVADFTQTAAAVEEVVNRPFARA